MPQMSGLVWFWLLVGFFFFFFFFFVVNYFKGIFIDFTFFSVKANKSFVLSLYW